MAGLGDDAWNPSVSIAIDEAGMLLRNSIARYYSGKEQILQEQIRSFASSGVPYDTCMVDDFLRHPGHSGRYKVIFFADMHNKDAERVKLIDRLERNGTKCVFLSSERTISPMEFAAIVRDAGGYVPAKYGLQVNMNGSFVSVHALRGGRFDFKLPRRCTVVNMKTGKVEVREADILPLDLVAGETCWFGLD